PPDGTPVDRVVIRQRQPRATSRRDTVDVALPTGVAPVDEAIARGRPGRLRRIAVDNLARRATGGIDNVEGRLALSTGRIVDLFGGERDPFAIGRPGRMKPEVGHAADGLAGGAGDEDAAVGVGLVKGD